MMKKKNIYCVSLFLFSVLQAQHTFILVPGTWSSGASWYRPGGSFFEAFKKNALLMDTSVVTFVWSGENSHQARVGAARKLAQLISCYDSVHLVTHSHGSNVGILATHFLSQLHLDGKVHYFFALATPVLAEEYFPNMNRVHYFINFFSLADKVQTSFGLFQRTFPKHERIANTRVMIEKVQPTHSGIHDQIIGSWLPVMPLIIESNENFFEKPSVISFSKNKTPYYEVDDEQQLLVALERDTFNLDFTFRKPLDE
jgi:hypothetical protein